MLDLVKTECRNGMLMVNMNISRIMTHDQQVEGDNRTKHDQENKKVGTRNAE